MQIDISSISLDVQNFRHKKVVTEREAMQIILSDEKTHKLSELAQDIIDMNGLDPSSLLIVTEDTNNPGAYIALEGNRRITALKTLVSPAIAAGTPGYATFKKLSPAFLGMGIDKVECVVLGRKDAFEWIKRKHYNAMGGKGVVAWNAVATARSDASEGRFARWMTGLNYLDQNGEVSDHLMDGITGKTTTVERVLGSPHIATTLGLLFDRAGNLAPENGDVKAACALLVAMYLEMGKKDFTETKVTSADLQRSFIESFENLNVRKKPQSGSGAQSGTHTQAGATGSSTGGGPAGSGSNSTGGSGTSSATGGTAQPQAISAQNISRSKPVKQRKWLAPSGLRISNHGLNKLYGELRKLNVDSSPHIAAVMIRIFLEKASMVFLDDMQVPCPNTNPQGWHEAQVKLRTKVASVLGIIDPQKSNKRLDDARDIGNATQGKTHTLDHLNRAIHNHLAIPSSLEIITGWDRLHPYFEALFEHLEKNGK
ncbi:hypothetical protein [Rhizobium leguminosarum]|uniref:hypothetical protein n=1 Tax=Rhizobium leguminosarum TaxID=384 RepID=UPI003F9A0F63